MGLRILFAMFELIINDRGEMDCYQNKTLQFRRIDHYSRSGVL